MDETIQTYRVDFNDVGGEDGDSIEVVVGTRTPEVGDSAVLIDAERNRCWALVEAIDGRIATLRVLDDTWTEPRSAEPTYSLSDALEEAVASSALEAWGDLLDRRVQTRAPEPTLEPVG